LEETREKYDNEILRLIVVISERSKQTVSSGESEEGGEKAFQEMKKFNEEEKWRRDDDGFPVEYLLTQNEVLKAQLQLKNDRIKNLEMRIQERRERVIHKMQKYDDGNHRNRKFRVVKPIVGGNTNRKSKENIVN